MFDRRKMKLPLFIIVLTTVAITQAFNFHHQPPLHQPQRVKSKPIALISYRPLRVGGDSRLATTFLRASDEEINEELMAKAKSLNLSQVEAVDEEGEPEKADSAEAAVARKAEFEKTIGKMGATRGQGEDAL